ncbi:EamA family transporter [Clostridium sediminicola]|uniref:DMT family transporter n=1 Tax=Clostridium sediminicola TaxID=3114879 RepID=UPI0031F230F8
MNRVKGSIFIILSAVIFGFTPILAKLSYLGGSNAIMLTFLRSFIALPVLYSILKYKRISLRITIELMKNIIILGFFGATLTTFFLYTSYNYISVGVATTIHFAYPTFVILSCILIYKERTSVNKILSLILATFGVLMFLGNNEGASMIGILLALLSAVSYAFLMVYMDKSELKELHPIKLSFYLCIIIASSMFIYGLITNSLTLKLTPRAWLYSLIVSLCVSVGALSLFQLGIKYIGASTASILSMLEPITSIILGVIILHENISLLKIVGSSLIVAAVIILTREKNEECDLNLDISYSNQN